MEQAHRIAPERDDIRYEAAIALDDCGETEKAADMYRALLETNENMTGAWFRLGAMYLRSGEFNAAVLCFETVSYTHLA